MSPQATGTTAVPRGALTAVWERPTFVDAQRLPDTGGDPGPSGGSAGPGADTIGSDALCADAPEPAHPRGGDAAASSPRRPIRTALARLGSPKVRTHLGTLAGVLILGILLWRLGTGVFLDGLGRIDTASVLLALGIGLVTTVFSAWRWALVARSLRIRLPFGPAVADYYRALFLNAALPGGVLGDVHRAVRHGQSEGMCGGA
ncbi:MULTISPECIES: lysylphosphatidylglycerol synthase transmembrane domain-containing protein [Streptomyces]|uniref:lysylphosphatidylglycerol synthase transmembrane domain-containing protein n=1 Tax=Streptomyces sp. SID5464 TaxID=2690293 RepID=UPI0002D5F815|nr:MULTISPECIES: lysylphosphatidylglycerol synthase transmembrane domain-containing protein [Streptomyces]